VGELLLRDDVLTAKFPSSNFKMDETGDPHIERNKPSSKSQISRFAHKQNLGLK
jgi:hypothetical protein